MRELLQDRGETLRGELKKGHNQGSVNGHGKNCSCKTRGYGSVARIQA